MSVASIFTFDPKVACEAPGREKPIRLEAHMAGSFVVVTCVTPMNCSETTKGAFS